MIIFNVPHSFKLLIINKIDVQIQKLFLLLVLNLQSIRISITNLRLGV